MSTNVPCHMVSSELPSAIVSLEWGDIMKVSKLLSCVLIFTFLASTAFASDYLIWRNADQTCTIDAYKGNATSLVIPSTIEGYAVTSIGDEAFMWCKSLTRITIPDSITTISEGAFFGCTSLEAITVNSRNPIFEHIQGILFNKSTKVLHTYPSGNKATAYAIPAGTSAIASYAFSGCDSLTSIDIPESVTSIGEGAFRNCDSLISVTIPASIITIAEGAFNGCTSLETVMVDPKNPTFAYIQGVLFNKAEKTLHTYPAGKKAKTYTIPEGITAIATSAFHLCSSLTSITIPDSVTSIREEAFWDCDSLISITIPNSVTSIDDAVFWNCNSLTSITIPNSVTSIGEYSFALCGSLSSITVSDSVTSIGEGAFSNCTSLTSITIPDSVISIGRDVFSYCGSLSEIKVEEESYAYEFFVTTELAPLLSYSPSWL